MNLITSTVLRNNLTVLSNWVDSTPVPQVIDTVTYDLYESNNPFRRRFGKEDIHNKLLRTAANTTTGISAEVFSVFANPYYVTHKITQVPAAYRNVVDVYRKYSSNK